jgi:ribonucleoside-diphosphate reductase alpha chain
MNLNDNAIKVLKDRYLLRDKQGKVVETPEQMFRRVAKNIAEAEKKYSKKKTDELEETFYNMMANLEFLPNSPTLMNAGTKLQQLAACFVLPIEDSMHGIFGTLENAAIIHQSGGGTGFSFSRIRPKGDMISTTKGKASGPLSFMKVYDKSTEVIKQGGKRRGANMGILRVDHPDILDFINSKKDESKLRNFNISVGITDKFMKALKSGSDYELINPRTKKTVKKIPAKSVFHLIVENAWSNGEPGIVFLDTMNKANPTPKIGEFESTNPCGEVPLLPYESCNLGSINLSRFVKDKKIDWTRLKDTIRNAVHFLDNVIDMNKYPLKEVEQIVKANRKIGLGVMGFADMLIQLDIEYGTNESLALAENLMKHIRDEAREESKNLAKKRGAFKNHKKSIYKLKLRNATLTSIAPTGTISTIASCSPSIEPLFAISYVKKTADFEFIELNQSFKEYAEDILSEELIGKIAHKGSLQKVKEVPDKVKKIFVTAHDIKPEQHVKMQAAFQKYTDNAVSKTVNLPYNATKKDIEKVFMLAYKLGCKGLTVYRDKSRKEQVIHIKHACEVCT